MKNKYKKRESLNGKIAAYTTLAGAFVATANTADAQIIYTDINPDITVSSGQYSLDLNNDNTPEFYINQQLSSYGSQIVGIINNNNGQGWVGYASGAYNYASKLDAGITVGSGALFNNPAPLTGFATMAYVTSYGSLAFGQWQGAVDKFLGLRFTFNGNTYYGWARLSVSASGNSFTIKDYAYNSTPNASIITGQTSGGIVAAPVASNVMASDVGDQGNGTDLQIDFNKASDESKIAEYRIIVVPSTDTASFDLAAANAVTSANYTTVAKTGSNISMNLSASATDKNGSPIVNNVDYNVYILSIADGTIATANALSAKSNVVKLQTIAAPVATGVMASDIGDQGNGTDLQVDFNKASDESQIGEYRIIVVPSVEAASFDLAAANAVTSSNYTTVAKTGSNISTTLSATATDKNGTAITNNTSYNVFILSIADGSIATVNALSAMSNSIELKNTVGIDDISAAGITAYSYGKEVHIYSPEAAFEDRIMIYDLAGKMLIDEAINGNSKRIILNNGPTGLYILKVSKNDNYFTKKIYIN